MNINSELIRKMTISPEELKLFREALDKAKALNGSQNLGDFNLEAFMYAKNIKAELKIGWSEALEIMLNDIYKVNTNVETEEETEDENQLLIKMEINKTLCEQNSLNERLQYLFSLLK